MVRAPRAPGRTPKIHEGVEPDNRENAGYFGIVYNGFMADDINELALQAFDVVAAARDKLKSTMGEGGSAVLDDIMELLTAAMQASYGERISPAFFNIRIERLSEYLKEPEKP